MIEQYITPDEAVNLSKHQFCSEITCALKIYDMAVSQRGGWNSIAIGVVFHAGVIAGIRMERAKRRRNK